MSLLPTIPTSDFTTELYFKYLEWLFRDYTSIRTISGYSVTEVGDSKGRSYNIDYSSNKKEMTVWYTTDDFVRFKYTPRSDYEAYQLYELVRTSGLDAVISEIKNRGIKSSKQIKNYKKQ
jgi:hypothetical protein